MTTVINSITITTPAIHLKSNVAELLPTVEGIGISDVVNGKASHLGAYQRWRHMLERCYSQKSLARKPTYQTKRVHPSWMKFSTFAKWYYTQARIVASCGYSIADLEMDSDLCATGADGEFAYSPNTVVFMPKSFNVILARVDGRADKKSGLPVGVVAHGTGYQFKVTDFTTGKCTRSPTYSDLNEAYTARCEHVVERIKNQIELHSTLLNAQGSARYHVTRYTKVKNVILSNSIHSMVNEAA